MRLSIGVFTRLFFPGTLKRLFKIPESLYEKLLIGLLHICEAGKFPTCSLRYKGSEIGVVLPVLFFHPPTGYCPFFQQCFGSHFTPGQNGIIFYKKSIFAAI